jgi:hypothetical protein
MYIRSYSKTATQRLLPGFKTLSYGERRMYNECTGQEDLRLGTCIFAFYVIEFQSQKRYLIFIYIQKDQEYLTLI